MDYIFYSGESIVFSSVFFVLVEENVCVRMVSAPSDFSVFHCFFHGAAWFVGVGAVVESAVLGGLEDFGEIMRDAVAFEFHKSECANSRSINNVTAKVER